MAKGRKTGGGRQLGSPNAITTALNAAGGVAYLTEQAHLNPGPFMTLLGKILPLQMTGADGAPIVLQLSHDDSEL